MSIFRKFMTLKVKALIDIIYIARINERINLYQFTSFSACFHVVSIILLVADLSNDKMRLSAKSSSSSDRTVWSPLVTTSLEILLMKS